VYFVSFVVLTSSHKTASEGLGTYPRVNGYFLLRRIAFMFFL
jgi:hypothetical protein